MNKLMDDFFNTVHFEPVEGDWREEDTEPADEDAEDGEISMDWNSLDHPRGQPKNKGEFVQKGTASAGSTKTTGTTRNKIKGSGFSKHSKVIFEVAPNPDDKELNTRWNKLDQHTKAVVSADIVDDILPEVLKTLGGATNSKFPFKVKKQAQFGGYLEETNPSLSLIPNKEASDAQVNLLARVLGSVLSQQSVMRVSTKPFKGSSKWGAVHIAVPTDISYKDTEKLYNKLRTEVVGDEGEQLIYGHTTDAGRMVILTDAGTEMNLGQKISKCLGNSYEVGCDTVNVDMPFKGNDDYQFERRNQSVDYTPLQKWVQSLKGKASASLNKRIAEYSGKE